MGDEVQRGSESDAPGRALTERESALLARVMRQQAALGIRVASVFIVLLVGIPVICAVAPALAATPIGGFTLVWLILGILFYPVTWVLSWWFVKESDAGEAAVVRDFREDRP